MIIHIDQGTIQVDESYGIEKLSENHFQTKGLKFLYDKDRWATNTKFYNFSSFLNEDGSKGEI